MRSQQHEQGQLHKRLPTAPYWSVRGSTSGIEGDERCADDEDNKSKEKSASHTATTSNTGLTGSTPKLNRDNSSSGKRTRRRRFCPHAWTISNSCLKCLANITNTTTNATTTTRHSWPVLAILGTFFTSAAAALVFLLLHSGNKDTTATTGNSNKHGLSLRLETPREPSLAGSPGGQELGGGRRKRAERTGAKVVARDWRGREGGASVAKVGSSDDKANRVERAFGAGEERLEGNRSDGSSDGPKVEEDKHSPVLSGSVKTCDTYLKDYGIVPGDSWGTAPKRAQDAWVKMNCDQVLGMKGFNLDDPPSGGRQRAIVLVWNEIAGWLDYLRPKFVSSAIETCPTECIFTNDRSLLPNADGVLFHGPTLKTRGAFPKVKPPGVDYVFVNLEPTTYRPVQSLLRNNELMSQFDLRMTYERDSDVPLGYVGSSSTSRYFKSPKATFQEKDGFGSPDAIAAFVSNCKASGATNRIKYMEELMEHATVHSFGYCLHNREEPKLVPGEGATTRQENKVALLHRYKFLLAFENNNQLRDYVTEKVYNGLQSGTLPVYWGAENVEDFVPKGSVVKASDFSSPAELGKHLKMLATNEEAYEAYFQWKDDPEEEKKFEQNVIARSAYGVNAMCRLCDRVVLNRDDDNNEP